ncbi:MAG: NUDIX domain-containing protein [Methylococcaceae bacterium]
MSKQFTVVKKETPFQGFFRVHKYWLKHTLYEGGWSNEISREVFERGSCIAVLLYDPNADTVILIEQFRAGAINSSDSEKAWLVEIVAGAIEEGETAESVAYRESLEEAGCTIEELMVINEFYTSPGGTSEKITLFCGKVDSHQVGGVHGLDHEDEDILVKAVPFNEAYAMVEDNTIESAIPIIALQWLALNRNTLREQWLN